VKSVASFYEYNRYFPGWDKAVYGDPRIGGALAGPPECVPQILEASNKSGLADEMVKKEERMSVLGQHGSLVA
jgi:hypothetical protein